jgi:hypothetical protein
MIVTPLRQDLIDQVHDLMALGEPYVGSSSLTGVWALPPDHVVTVGSRG